MQRFDPPKIYGGLFAPAIILGTPAEAGVFIPKCSMALAKTFQTLC